MKIAIIGTGYVGLPTGTGLAELGNDVICIDKDTDKIKALQSGKITLYEEGLDELFARNIAAGRLKFTSSMKEGIMDADVVIIAVGTPPHPVTKEADMCYIQAAATEMAKYLTGYTVVATKSTVPVGTGEMVEEIIKRENPFADYDVVSMPEFLREGFAVYDFFNPDRIVIGTNSEKARKVLREVYKDFKDKSYILFVGRRSAETIKYASNAFLAMKIHYINEMSNFCEKANADITEVALGMGLDSRIGNKFLNPGPGYGGSCFPKDTMAMAYMGRKFNVDLSLIEKTIEQNRARKTDMAERILASVKDIKNPKIAVLGLAFKGGTDDCRESPAVEIISDMLKHKKGLLHKKPNIIAYDPKAMDNAKNLLGRDIEYADDPYAAANGADILVILTEWKEFKDLDLKRIKELMHTHKIMDLRNILDPETAINLGFEYTNLGSCPQTSAQK